MLSQGLQTTDGRTDAIADPPSGQLGRLQGHSYPAGPTCSYLVRHPGELRRRSMCSSLDGHVAFLSNAVCGFVLWKRFISLVTSDYFTVQDRKPGAFRGVGRLCLYPLPSQKACAPNIPCVPTVWGEAGTNSSCDTGRAPRGRPPQDAAAVGQ